MFPDVSYWPINNHWFVKAEEKTERLVEKKSSMERETTFVHDNFLVYYTLLTSLHMHCVIFPSSFTNLFSRKSVVLEHYLFKKTF